MRAYPDGDDQSVRDDQLLLFQSKTRKNNLLSLAVVCPMVVKLDNGPLPVEGLNDFPVNRGFEFGGYDVGTVEGVPLRTSYTEYAVLNFTSTSCRSHPDGTRFMRDQNDPLATSLGASYQLTAEGVT